MFKEKRERVANSEEEEAFSTKLEMCRLQFEGAAIPGARTEVSVSDAERVIFERKLHDSMAASATSGSSPASGASGNKAAIRVGSLDLLQHLASFHSGDVLHLCLGADAYLDLCAGKWFKASEIGSMVGGHIHVIYREDGAQGVTHEDLAAMIAAQAGSFGATLHVVEGLGDVSSTMARECVNKEALRRIVGDAVCDYIVEHQMYKFAGV
jgi:hypothetical protein